MGNRLLGNRHFSRPPASLFQVALLKALALNSGCIAPPHLTTGQNRPSRIGWHLLSAGNPVSFTTQTIKGISYAVFPASPGTYAP